MECSVLTFYSSCGGSPTVGPNGTLPHTTEPKLTELAGKHRPLMPTLREIILCQDTPLGSDVKHVIICQLDEAEDRFAASCLSMSPRVGGFIGLMGLMMK